MQLTEKQKCVRKIAKKAYKSYTTSRISETSNMVCEWSYLSTAIKYAWYYLIEEVIDFLVEDKILLESMLVSVLELKRQENKEKVEWISLQERLPTENGVYLVNRPAFITYFKKILAL